MDAKGKNILDNVIYSYTTQNSQLEDENKILKETIDKLKDEIENFRKPPLMVCEVNDIIKESKEESEKIYSKKIELKCESNDFVYIGESLKIICEIKNYICLQ